MDIKDINYVAIMKYICKYYYHTLNKITILTTVEFKKKIIEKKMYYILKFRFVFNEKVVEAYVLIDHLYGYDKVYITYIEANGGQDFLQYT